MHQDPAQPSVRIASRIKDSNDLPLNALQSGLSTMNSLDVERGLGNRSSMMRYAYALILAGGPAGDWVSDRSDGDT